MSSVVTPNLNNLLRKSAKNLHFSVISLRYLQKPSLFCNFTFWNFISKSAKTFAFRTDVKTVATAPDNFGFTPNFLFALFNPISRYTGPPSPGTTRSSGADSS
jgi:hypothetical protein